MVLIKSTVGKDTEIIKDGDKSIQDETDVVIEVPKTATQKERKEVALDIMKEYSVVQNIGQASEKVTIKEANVDVTL